MLQNPHLELLHCICIFKNKLYPAVDKEQTAKGGVLYEGRMFSRWL